MMDRQADDDRGQAFTLEAVVGAILLLTAIAFALQVTVVTPLSASTSSQHIESQQRSTAQGVLASAAEDGSLKRAVLYWNATGNRFHNTPAQRFYTNGSMGNEFGNKLNRAFSEEGLAYNVRIYHQTNTSERTAINQQTMISQGTPSDNAVRATRTIAIKDDDHLVDEDGSLNESTVSDVDFYMKDARSYSNGIKEKHGLYNVVEVEVIVWRI